MQTVDPRTVRPDVDVGRPKTPEVAVRPVPVWTTIAFVLAIVVLVMAVVILTTGAPVAEIHDSWMNYPAYGAAAEIHDSWANMANLAPVEIHDSWMNIP
ncbi:MAG: hypothetical protein RI637_01390 [Acidimicrobiia bacterium]|nr:hypothetical protein [Acidimicrobiia bacterium]